MNFKLYKDANNTLFNYPLDGSQDHLIGNKIAVTTQEEADILITNQLAKQGLKTIPSYVIQRSKEYPSLTQFADAWVKQDEAALEQYRQACLAVKAKYPKPEGF